jgi:hypothetical protein
MTNTPPAEGSREWLAALVAGRHPAINAIMQHFAWSHLDGELAITSRLCARLALRMVERVVDDPELTAGLRALLQAKDCFVRAHLITLRS